MRKLNSTQFRLLLLLIPLLSLASAVMGAVGAHALFRNLDPAQIREVVQATGERISLVHWISQCEYILGVVGWFGMFAFYRPARAAYLASFLLHLPLLVVSSHLPNAPVDENIMSIMQNGVSALTSSLSFRALLWLPEIFQAAIIYLSFSRHAETLFRPILIHVSDLTLGNLVYWLFLVIGFWILFVVGSALVNSLVFYPAVRYFVPDIEQAGKRVRDARSTIESTQR